MKRVVEPMEIWVSRELLDRRYQELTFRSWGKENGAWKCGLPSELEWGLNRTPSLTRVFPCNWRCLAVGRFLKGAQELKGARELKGAQELNRSDVVDVL